MLFVSNKIKIIGALISSGIHMPEYDVKQQNAQNTNTINRGLIHYCFLKTIRKRFNNNLLESRIKCFIQLSVVPVLRLTLKKQRKIHV